MKRQIVCHKCYMKKMPNKQYDGEWYKVKNGKARTYIFCDLCGGEIEKDEQCHAESMGLNSQPYYSWESQYIKKED